MDWSKLDNSPSVLRAFLETEGLAPKKRWGQNFMVAPGARAAVVNALGIAAEDVVWEIGPGFGAITSLLVPAARSVVVFEIDHGIIRILNRRFGDQVHVVAGDATKSIPAESADSRRTRPDLIVGNLPYRSAAAIIAVLLETDSIRSSCRCMVFTVQREMARRMTSLPGQKEYSPFTVLCSVTGTVKNNGELAAGSFYPVPDVVSSLVTIRPKTIDPQLLETCSICARSLFGSRRKTIRNNLSALCAALRLPMPVIEQALAQSGVDASRRAETIEPELYLRLAGAILSRPSNPTTRG